MPLIGDKKEYDNTDLVCLNETDELAPTALRGGMVPGSAAIPTIEK